MPTFVMLSTLGPDGSAKLRDNPGRLREVRSEVKGKPFRQGGCFAGILPALLPLTSHRHRVTRSEIDDIRNP